MRLTNFCGDTGISVVDCFRAGEAVFVQTMDSLSRNVPCNSDGDVRVSSLTGMA